ncbi:MAG TPA: tetratricopeptide repeat protein [Bdellovibrio sp.]|nr:tetratricopeptide repeat protein [Bdellovibrio sp.]
MMNSLFVALLTAATTLMMTGCLQTRNDVRENEQRNVMQQQVSTLQKTNADTAGRFSDLEEQMRALNGRVEVAENKMDRSNSSIENALKNSQQQNQDLGQKVAILQDALTKMEKEVNQLSQEVQALKTQAAAAPPAHSSHNKESSKDSYESGENFFNKKDWKQAILQYQKYRDENAKGAHFADATYKIGVSFQELGMKDESKTFYDEVISKFPKSAEARRAKIRLKGLKK